MKYAAFLARFQPLHNAHLHMINLALRENDKLVIVLGSSNKNNMLRNPFDFNLRKEMLSNSLQKEDMDRITIFELPDWSMESNLNDAKIWGRYLYYNMASRTQFKHFTFYYSDNPYIMKNWFNDTEIENYINYSFQQRNELFEGLSATKIRDAFQNQDLKYVIKYCPKSVYANYDKLREIWMNVINNPQEDFSM